MEYLKKGQAPAWNHFSFFLFLFLLIYDRTTKFIVTKIDSISLIEEMTS